MAHLSWRKSLVNAAKEFPMQNFNVIEGKIPHDLRGSLYRNGPARFERGKDRASHWFDGDGAVLGVHFSDGKARGTYKYVQSEGYKNEEKANRLLSRGFGTYPPGPFWKRLFSPQKNYANTSVMKIDDKLLALWEGGWPHHLDPETIETIKMDDLGFLKDTQSFSAHPKIDHRTGEIFNIGGNQRSRKFSNIWKCDKHGKVLAQTQFLDRMNMIHDFVISEKYAIVFNFPTKFGALLPFITGLKSFKESLTWAPELGTEIYVFDKNDLSLVNRFKVDPFYVYHFMNAHDEKDGSIYIEFVKYDTYSSIDKTLADLADLKNPMRQGFAGKLGYLRVDPKLGKQLELKDIGDENVEFPTVAKPLYGQNWRYSMFNIAPKKDNLEETFFSAFGRLDRKTGNMKSYNCGKDTYVSEPLLISSEKDLEEGYILTTIYDAKNDQGELHIHHSSTIGADPLCRMALPEVVAPGFHGTWCPK